MRQPQIGINDLIRHHWDRRATTFDDETAHRLISEEQRQAWLDLLSRYAGPPPQRVLDVGCGTGFLAFRLAELGHIVTGIDLSPRMIGIAQRKAEEAAQQIGFQIGDAAALDVPDETCDLVVARHVIWNLPDPERGVAEWLRVLRPGGRLLLIEGKWADNEELARANARLTSRILARAVDTAAAVAVRIGGHPQRLLNRGYRRIEAQLPFSGGPEATRLAEFLTANSVRDVVIDPLMDPTLWGEVPKFPRYVATGTRAADSKPDVPST
jgi:ubiquinone/menaquinone biosynthesis C-methylase UbiE